MINDVFGKPLTNSDIAKLAPSVLNTEGPSDNVTERYSFFPTIRVVDDMRQLGWLPYRTEQRKVYKARKGFNNKKRHNFTKHMIVFRNPEFSLDNNTLVPEIILTNSHDGRNSFEFFLSLYVVDRHSYSIIWNKELENYKIRHKGYSYSVVENLVTEIIHIIPTVVTIVNKLKSTTLSDEKKIKFVRKCFDLRWSGKEINIEEEINPVRKIDESNDLWTILQIVQEKLIFGGVKYKIKSKGKIRIQTGRAIENIDQKIELRKSLWEYVEKFKTY